MILNVSTIEHALSAVGLVARGAFHPRPADGVPRLPDSRPAATVVLAGNVGDSIWRPYQRARRAAGGRLTLDAWSRAVLEEVACTFGAHALFPFEGPPYLPFQAWAQRAEPVLPSPIGPLIHPEYGLWHAYRGALAFADALVLREHPSTCSPCERCVARPCLSTCPVGALADGSYDVARCVEHVTSEAGDECRAGGCLARRACPVGTEHRYPREQTQFHMAAFLRRVQETGGW